jgi:hypothetical protein
MAYLVIAMRVHEVWWVGLHLQASMYSLNVVVCNSSSSSSSTQQTCKTHKHLVSMHTVSLALVQLALLVLPSFAVTSAALLLCLCNRTRGCCHHISHCCCLPELALLTLPACVPACTCLLLPPPLSGSAAAINADAASEYC